MGTVNETPGLTEPDDSAPEPAMDTWVAFLTARLDEDEAAAKDHTCINCGRRTAPLRNVFGVTGYTHDGGWEGVRCPGSVTGAVPVQDPGRMLREAEAGRKLLAAYADACINMPGGGWHEALQEVIKIRAAVYSTHPDYPGREQHQP